MSGRARPRSSRRERSMLWRNPARRRGNSGHAPIRAARFVKTAWDRASSARSTCGCRCGASRPSRPSSLLCTWPPRPGRRSGTSTGPRRRRRSSRRTDPAGAWAAPARNRGACPRGAAGPSRSPSRSPRPSPGRSGPGRGPERPRRAGRRHVLEILLNIVGQQVAAVVADERRDGAETKVARHHAGPDLEVDDAAVFRCDQRGVVEVEPGLRELRLHLGDGGIHAVDLGLRRPAWRARAPRLRLLDRRLSDLELRVPTRGVFFGAGALRGELVGESLLIAAQYSVSLAPWRAVGRRRRRPPGAR